MVLWEDFLDSIWFKLDLGVHSTVPIDLIVILTALDGDIYEMLYYAMLNVHIDFCFEASTSGRGQYNMSFFHFTIYSLHAECGCSEVC